MHGFPGVGLVQAGHDHRVAEIKHLRGHQRCGSRAASSLLLQIQRGDAIGLRKRMIVCGTQHSELFRNVRGPGCSVVIRDSCFQCLPRGDDGLFGLVFRLVGYRFAGVFAVGHARAARACFLTAKSNFVIDEQAPAGAALNP